MCSTTSTSPTTQSRWPALVLPWPLFITWFCLADLGGFPSNDDPFYGRPAQILAQESRFQVTRQMGELAASSAAHVVIGGALSWLLGFSYRTLYLAVILQLWLAAIAVYGIGLAAKASGGFSLFWAAVFLYNPLCFGHGFTFMTDGPAMCWCVYAVYCFQRGLRRNSLAWLVFGSAAAGVAFWMRQTHVLIVGFPMAAVCMLWFRGQKQISPWKALSASLILASLAVLLFESGWIVFGDDGRLHSVVPREFDVWRNATNTYGLAILIGFLFLPAMPLLFERARRLWQSERWSAPVLVGTVVAALLFAPLAGTQGRACLTSATGTFIQNAHLGPIFLSDFELPGRWGQMGGVSWPAWVWQLLTVLAIVNAGLLACWVTTGCVSAECRSEGTGKRLARGPVAGRDLNIAIMFGLAAAACPIVAVVLSISTGVLDRYWMALLPLLFAIVPEAFGRANCDGEASVERVLERSHLPPRFAESVWPSLHPCIWLVSTGFLGLQLCFSILLVRDFLAWNQTRWKQVEAWLAEGYLPLDIDGGRDINAWYRSAEDSDTMPRPGDPGSWWCHHATLALAVGPREGWEEFDRIRWRAWATGNVHEILLLRRTSDTVQKEPAAFVSN